ncbi:Phytase-like domain-containing protein [Rhodanobacter sp. Root179]|uniref:hypothetical protein n=1 Tax=Rhodanobacter sp. Root179 TaxID=1736482 RepID=UPI000A9C5B38|nr:hypothetical protein [Rhodanobacter sp. Root179]
MRPRPEPSKIDSTHRPLAMASPPVSARAVPGRSWRTLGKLLIVCLLVTGCQPDMAGDGGSTGMFGLFKKKAEALPSTVAPELHAQLKRETSFPQQTAAADQGCTEARVDGTPPDARFVSPDFTGPVHDAFRVTSRPGLPALAIVNGAGEVRLPQFWELASDATPTFVRNIPVQLDPAQGSWITASARDVGCLPGPWLVLGLGYSTSRPSEYVALYNRETHQVRKIADAVSAGYSVYDGPSGHADSLLETRSAGPGRALLLYHTDQLRLRAEVYVRKYDHIMLFSPQHPQGLEVIKLGLDDGNVIDWTVIDKTLWLRTRDRRNDKQPDGMVWSLDLSSVF